MAGKLKDLQNLLEKVFKGLPQVTLQVMEVEGLNMIKQNFRDQGFNNGSTEKWKARKTTDREGRDLTRHRSNRHGPAGSLTKFGRENIGRAILVGHNTGGDKLINSFRARKQKRSVVLYTYKNYAARHNEGLDGMPKRQFMGVSKTLQENIEKKLTKELDKLFS